MSKAKKKRREKEIRSKQDREKVYEEMLHYSKKRFKKFDEVILQLYNKEDLSLHFSDRRIWKVNDCFCKFSSKAKLKERIILKDVLIYLEKYSSTILDEDYIQAVFNMVLFRAYWRKDIFKWKPLLNRSEKQLNELAFYLFCEYNVPEFLYEAFYEKKDRLHIIWFMHIGTGKRIRELAKMPIPFTQKMAHYFLQAPAMFSVPEALRWAQVKGLGGDERLAERIVYSWIGNKPYGDEIFWETFIRLVVNGGLFNYDKLTDIIDYVREAKAANPDYNLKGRNLQSLLKQSDEWHRKDVLIKGPLTWNSCGIESYKFEKKEDVITLEELLGSKLLRNEGRAMKHCVGSYVTQCRMGKSAIFSMRKYSLGMLNATMATIEVNLELKRIVQARAKANSIISEEARKHLNLWAKNQGLSINAYL